MIQLLNSSVKSVLPVQTRSMTAEAEKQALRRQRMDA